MGITKVGRSRVISYRVGDKKDVKEGLENLLTTFFPKFQGLQKVKIPPRVALDCQHVRGMGSRRVARRGSG